MTISPSIVPEALSPSALYVGLGSCTVMPSAARAAVGLSGSPGIVPGVPAAT